MIPGIHKLLDKEIEILVNIVSDSRGEEKKQNEGYPLSLKCRCETALAKMEDRLRLSYLYE